MNVFYLCLFLASQLALQSYLVMSNVAPTSTLAVPVFVALTLLQAGLTYGCLIASTVNPPYTMPVSRLGKFIKISGETLFWYCVLGCLPLVGVAVAFPSALAATDLWSIIWQSAVLGSLVNGLVAPPLTRHFLNQQ